jgi:hypothetical protein
VRRPIHGETCPLYLCIFFFSFFSLCLVYLLFLTLSPFFLFFLSISRIS